MTQSQTDSLIYDVMMIFLLHSFCSFLSVVRQRSRKGEMAPKKGKEVENTVVEPIIEDPALIAARAEREKQQAEDRKTFERNEMIDRRRVEAMEQVGWRCLQHEREKRLDPSGWAGKVANKSPSVVFVKQLAGNRAIPQQIFKVSVNAETSVLLLKSSIRDEAVKAGGNAALFAPEKQKLYFLTKEISVPDEYNCTLKSLNISGGATVHVALDVPNSWEELVPSKVK